MNIWYTYKDVWWCWWKRLFWSLSYYVLLLVVALVSPRSTIIGLAPPTLEYTCSIIDRRTVVWFPSIIAYKPIDTISLLPFDVKERQPQLTTVCHWQASSTRAWCPGDFQQQQVIIHQACKSSSARKWYCLPRSKDSSLVVVTCLQGKQGVWGMCHNIIITIKCQSVCSCSL